MNLISRNLKGVLAGGITLMLGIAAVNTSGQTTVTRGSDSGRRDSESGFCSSQNYSDDGRASANEIREMTVQAGGTLSVDGETNGGIGVRGEDRGDILIRACVQAWGTDQTSAKAATSAVQISTGPTVRAEAPNEKNWSVSYQILVPRNTSLNLKAHNGGISINGVDGTEEFETQNGGINLSNVAGSVKGHTTNGGVNVTLTGTSWKGSGLDVTTTNGGVRVMMPQNYAAHVETGTVNGGFNSDIPGLAVQPLDNDRKYGPRPSKVSTDLNGGGAPIRVVTTNGGVRISSDKE